MNYGDLIKETGQTGRIAHMEAKKCTQFYLAHLKRIAYCRDMEGGNTEGNFKRMRSDDGERKMPRKIFGPVKENYVWRIRTNQNLIDLQREPDIVSEIRTARLRWLGHVERMAEEITMKKVFKSIPEGKRSISKTRDWWLNIAENDLKEIGVRGWRKIARDTDAWKLLL